MTTLPTTAEAWKESGYGYGAFHHTVSKQQLEDLLAGKTLTDSVNSEYAIFITLEGVPSPDPKVEEA
jgi:hypothetical protein